LTKIHSSRTVVVRRLARASHGQWHLVSRTVVDLHSRTDSLNPSDRGLIDDAAAAGRAYADLGGMGAMQRWLAWRRGPGQLRRQAEAMRRWAVEVSGLQWHRFGVECPAGGVYSWSTARWKRRWPSAPGSCRSSGLLRPVPWAIPQRAAPPIRGPEGAAADTPCGTPRRAHDHPQEGGSHAQGGGWNPGVVRWTMAGRQSAGGAFRLHWRRRVETSLSHVRASRMRLTMCSVCMPVSARVGSRRFAHDVLSAVIGAWTCSRSKVRGGLCR
jgi:hypothetical protein